MKKSSDTNKLIQKLTQQSQPFKYKNPTSQFWAMIVISVLICGAFVGLSHNNVAETLQARPVQFGLWFILAAYGLWLIKKLLQPTNFRAGRHLTLYLLALLLSLTFTAQFDNSTTNTKSDLHCAAFIIALYIPLLFIACAFLQKSYSTQPFKLSIISSATLATLTLISIELVCTLESVDHSFISHFLSLLALFFIASFTCSKLFKW